MLRDGVLQFVTSQPVARLATADKAGRPHVVPVCFAVIDTSLYVGIDGKPKRVGGPPLKRLRNIEENPEVAVIVDHYDDDWSKLAWVMLRGRADILSEGQEYDRAQAALKARYQQYRSMDLTSLPVIAVRITRVAEWGAVADIV